MNGIPIPNGPVDEVEIAVGDVITAKIYLRDWSPNSEPLRAYQMTLDPESFATGEEGVVQPVEYQMHPDRDPNCLIDTTDPEWVHAGRPTLPLSDSGSTHYRWLSVLLNDDGPVSKQNGKKFACATIKLTPSRNANGVFSIALVEDPSISFPLNNENQPINPVEFERLKVEVSSTARWRKLLSSDPPNGSVDARRPAGKGAGPWDKLSLVFNCESEDLPVEDLLIEDGTATPPKVESLTGNGPAVMVGLSRPIRVGGWTKITHKPSQTSTRIAFFPGDVNADGKADSDDVMAIIRALNRQETLPALQFDVDRSGSLGAGDLTAVLDLVAPDLARRATRTAGTK